MVPTANQGLMEDLDMGNRTGEKGYRFPRTTVLLAGICSIFMILMISTKSLAFSVLTMLRAISCFFAGIISTGPIWTTVIIALLAWNNLKLAGVQEQFHQLRVSNRLMLTGVNEYRESQLALIDIYRGDLKDLVWKLSFQQADLLCRARLRNHKLGKQQVEIAQAYYGRGNQ